MQEPMVEMADATRDVRATADNFVADDGEIMFIKVSLLNNHIPLKFQNPKKYGGFDPLILS